MAKKFDKFDTMDDVLEDEILDYTEETDELNELNELDEETDELDEETDELEDELDESDEVLEELEVSSKSAVLNKGSKPKQRRAGTTRNRHRKTSKQRKQKNIILLGVATAIALLTVICAIAVISKYTPTKEKMSGYDYFEVEQSDNALIIMNNKMLDEVGIYENGRLYVTQEFVAKNLNQRFYLDVESDSVIFTNGTELFSYKIDQTTYTDSTGKKYEEAFATAIEINEKVYIDFEYISGFSDFRYTYGENPKRVVISNEFIEKEYITVTKETAVRYRGGIKSPVLEMATKGSKLVCTKSLDGWVEVRTESGFLGYIKADCVSETTKETVEHVYTDDFPSASKNGKITLAWFQVTNATANSNITDNLDGTQGITTISPTWYSITSNVGDMSCLATKAFVDSMHAKGLEVWPLIDDFSDAINGSTLYASKAARTKIINTLVNDAKKYGYDGLNLDCEEVTADSAKHFLQFVRELSVACRNNQIILSSDNYKPASFNAFYDLEEQSAFVDYIIIMGYDEHYAGSESGSVASIGFVEEGILNALELVPASKLINAVPFFTRIWTITNGTGATTSKAVGMQSAIDDLNAHKAAAIWNETAGQYFGSYEISGAVVKIWLEQDQSIEEKMKLIQKNNLAGVAAWKLGLENKSVWSVIAKYNQ